MIIISSNFIFNFINFCVIASFVLNKLRTSGISYSTAVTTALVAKLVILGVSFLTSFILALKETLVTRLVILSISFLTLFILALKAVLVAKLVKLGI